MQPVSGQRNGKHVPAATNRQATEERCFLCAGAISTLVRLRKGYYRNDSVEKKIFGRGSQGA
jgi:hypothetical protein